MPMIHDKKTPVVEPVKKPAENKAKALPLGHWLNLVKGMDRQAAEAALKMHRCPPPMMEQVLEVLSKSSEAQKKPTKATPAPEAIEAEAAPAVEGPALDRKAGGKLPLPGA